VGVIVIILVLAVAGLVAWYSYLQKQKRREELFEFAATHALTWSREDPWSIPSSYGFRLFSVGDGRGCENVLAGVWDGLPVREADYWYYDQSTDSKGNRSRTYHRFSIVIADLPCSVPHVSIEKETLLSRMADHLGFADLTFESEEFNRAYQVRSTDREFAYKLIDARMMQWLLSMGQGFGFEIMGPNLLAYSGKRRPTELIPLFGMAKLFDEHVPNLVWTDYGIGPTPTPAVPPPPGQDEAAPGRSTS
jgi:hypothetical protein